MTPEEARKKLIDTATRDIAEAEQIIDQWVHESGIPLMQAIETMEAACANMRVIGRRLGGG